MPADVTGAIRGATNPVASGYGPAMGAAPNSGWSGPQSDPVAPPSTAMAAVSHLGFLVLGPLLPLGLYLLTDRSDRFSRDHEREALNFQLTLMIPVMLSLVAFVAAKSVTKLSPAFVVHESRQLCAV